MFNTPSCFNSHPLHDSKSLDVACRHARYNVSMQDFFLETVRSVEKSTV